MGEQVSNAKLQTVIVRLAQAMTTLVEQAMAARQLSDPDARMVGLERTQGEGGPVKPKCARCGRNHLGRCLRETKRVRFDEGFSNSGRGRGNDYSHRGQRFQGQCPNQNSN